MRVMFITQCSKNALVETRRIIDQFAERKGDCTWITHITEQGLQTIKQMLKASARKNTAVSCHLFRGSQAELLWIVGNAHKFNKEGNVPTNITTKNILRADDENTWHTCEAIAVLASIAGLFHDFGKANELFQLKLKSIRNKSYEPYRHEWISLLLFNTFVGESTDQEWLERLSKISFEDENQLIKKVPKEKEKQNCNLLSGLPKIAKIVGWLILSHHRLPVINKNKLDNLKLDNREPLLGTIGNWIDQKRFNAFWNSYNCEDKDWTNEEFKKIVEFTHGTPLRSKSWCKAAHRAGYQALKNYHLLDKDWFQDRFSMHLMRSVLMLADHCYSSDIAYDYLQDAEYLAYANTYKGIKGKLKQKLDEHNIGVAKNAYFIAKNLPRIQENMPSITRHKGFKKRNQDSKFMWQDKAFDLASSLKEKSYEQGFFGINLASTGCGKTLANARIMYGLSDENKGCRFSIALGLRVLTLQTGDALKEKLSLNNDDVAVLIGSRAFQELHELKNQEELLENNITSSGSESEEELLEEQDYVRYEGALVDGRLNRWLKNSNKLHKMVSAPILVSTIDHLIPATEGVRGGKQIAPLLRLLTSDLILDEPDDFDVTDLPGLCRLVNFAGVYGSRVLLSSATLPPSIVKALFEAYASGRKIYNKACKKESTPSTVCCAWFDEFGVSYNEHESTVTYMASHDEYINERIKHLEKQPVLRKAEIVSIDLSSADLNSETAMARVINTQMYDLHGKHHSAQPGTGKKLSIGIVRMANIDPMIAMIKSILTLGTRDDYYFHYCVYHSRFPLLIRSNIEESLDRILTRHNANNIWSLPEISLVLKKPQKNHIFIVFATPVAEVGRDHDYDWAIVEPSSMRSIIQLAGRVQRHRRTPPSEINIKILQYNIKSLQGANIAFERPGFESKIYKLASKNLKEILLPCQYEQVTSIPRLKVLDLKNYENNLVDLEHMRLDSILFETKSLTAHASLWWRNNEHWCGELQRKTPFRKKDGVYKDYFLFLEDEFEEPKLHEWIDKGKYICIDSMTLDRISEKSVANNFEPWINYDVKTSIIELAQKLNSDVAEISKKFATVTLKVESDKWQYHPIFGFHRLKLPVRQ